MKYWQSYCTEHKVIHKMNEESTNKKFKLKMAKPEFLQYIYIGFS